MPRAFAYPLKKKKKFWDGMVSGLFYRWQNRLWERPFAQGLTQRWRQDSLPREQIPLNFSLEEQLGMLLLV